MPRGARSDPQGDPTAAIRAAIRRIADQREQTRTHAGRTLATQEQVRQAVRDQRNYLDAARADIDAAIAAAERAAESARSDAAQAARRAGTDEAQVDQLATAAAFPFEQTSRGLMRQRDVIDQAAGQLDAAAAGAAEEITRSRALIAASLRSLDTALRAEVALLVQFERAERARIIAEARRSGR